MKAKILLTALLTFLLVNGKASQLNSSLVIDLNEHPRKSYLVEFGDGSVYESNGDFRINRLRQGVHQIKIFERRFQRRRNQQVSNDRLVYVGAVQVPRNSTVFSQLVNRRLLVNRIVKKRAPRPRAARGMHQQDFRQLKRTVAQEAFDKDRLQVLRFATKNNYLTSRQVAQLMDLLTFEKYKLKFAKFAYQSTVDKQNYFQVRNKLTFSSSRKKLIRFIETQPVRNRGGRRR
ncbi:MAG: DUF4476 domain-containing protein [Flavobacteriales bacterium]